MADLLSDLERQLASLREIRAQGTRSVEFSAGNGGSRRVEYRSDHELLAAINDLERRIAQLKPGRVSVVRIQSSKGL